MYYKKTEILFEKLTSVATSILGNSITFILALCLVIGWLTNKLYYAQTIDDSIRDLIQGITFLSLFIIQKSFNRFSAILHLKLNELVSSHETANNAVMHMTIKTEREIMQMAKEYENEIRVEQND